MNPADDGNDHIPGIDIHTAARHHRRSENSLGRDRMLCRGEFGAAVSEKRRSIRSRRAEIFDFPV